MTESKPLSAPTNWFVTAVNAALDALIKKLGADAAYAAVIAAVPWLGAPVIGYIVKSAISTFASIFDTKLKVFVDDLIVKAQNEARLIGYESAFDTLRTVFNNPGASNEEVLRDIQAAKDAADRLINRNK
jgi:hypothetical protein